MIKHAIRNLSQYDLFFSGIIIKIFISCRLKIKTNSIYNVGKKII